VSPSVTSTAGRLAAFVTALVLVFGLSFAFGRIAGPEVEPSAHDQDDHGAAREGDASSTYSLRLGQRSVPAGADRRITFRVLDEHGDPVTAYDVRHERRLHLIVVGVDNMRDYRHVHPKLNSDGVWSVALDLAPGRHQVYADTQPSGADPVVLEGRLLAVGHRPGTTPLPEPVTTAKIGKYVVALAAEHGRITFSVSRGGRPVTDLQPYLGAFGHLVVIREDDLAYLHAHPEDGPAGPEVAFDVEFGAAGRHALYLDFKHAGVVRTAMFTVDAGGEDEGASHDGH
jgi:hypothetical protein